MKRVLIIAGVVLIDVLAICLMVNFGNGRIEDLGYDTAKLSIQLLLIVLFGGIVIQKYNHARARKDAINEFKRTFLRNLSRAYSDAKGVRRILRAKCVPMPKNEKDIVEDGISLATYDAHISTINSTQLELETMALELSIIKDVFPETARLIGYITFMEKYLGKIISEYEKILKEHHGATDLIPLSRLPRLRAFVKKTKEPKENEKEKAEKIKDERTEFLACSESYHDALVIIQKERIKVV